MSRVTQYQSSFTVGEIDPLLQGRIDLAQYEAGLDRAKNVVVLPQGGFERRPGLRFMQDLTSDLGSVSETQGFRLIPFQFNIEQSYMLVFVKINSNATNNVRMYVYANEILQTNINSTGNNYLVLSLGNIDLTQLSFTQSADTLILVQETLAPLKIVRGADNSSWTASTISLTDPKHAFSLTTSNPSADITPDAADGTVKITASSGIFTDSNVHQFINVLNGFGRARIIERESSTVVKAIAEVPFFEADVAITSGNWELESGYEDAFSTSRGFPKTATFHEGRLYFGGTTALPSTLFGSKVSDFFNFQTDEGLADDAIKITLSTDTANAITAIRSGRDLQVFTTGGEFFIPQAELDPITPDNIVVKTATKRGSKEHIKPVAAEGGTLFIQRQGKAIREFLFSDADLNYAANNISLLASHLLKNPRHMALRLATSTDDGDLLLIVNGTDGSMAAFSILRSQNVVAPSEFITDGTFLDVAVDISDIYVIVKRTIGGASKYYLEVFDDDRTTDANIQYFNSATSPDQGLPGSTAASSLDHLEGRQVKVIRDDVVLPDKTVASGAITLDVAPTSYAEVGLDYDVEVKTLPAEPKLSSGVVVSRRRRIAEVTAVVDRTQNLTVNGFEVSLRELPHTLGSTLPLFTGRKRTAGHLGYSDTAQITIGMSQPVFMTVLSLEYKLSTGG